MCEKNHYGRKAVTVLLAVLTALLVLSFMTGSRAVAADRPNFPDRFSAVRIFAAAA